MPARKKARRPATRKTRRPAAPKARRHVERHEPETLRLRAASPGFTVDDLGKSMDFYEKVMGFTIGERWEHDGKLAGVDVVAGTVHFMLSQDDWKKGRDRKKGEGFRIHCTTAQDVDKLAVGIKARGGKLTQEPRDEPWGMRDFALTDPDGFRITISSRG